MTVAVTEEQLVQQVAKAIRMSDRPALPEWILTLPGFGTPRVSSLLNALCAHDSCRYLEFGTLMGRSLCAAAYRNPTGWFIGVDNFSELTPLEAEPKLRTHLQDMIDLHASRNILFLKMDWRTFQGWPRTKFDVFFYDAGHTYEDTRDALIHVAPMLANPAVVIIDDWEVPNWAGHVESGTWEGLAVAKLKVRHDWELRKADGWHEGLWVGIVEQA